MSGYTDEPWTPDSSHIEALLDNDLSFDERKWVADWILKSKKLGADQTKALVDLQERHRKCVQRNKDRNAELIMARRVNAELRAQNVELLREQSYCNRCSNGPGESCSPACTRDGSRDGASDE